MPAATTAANGQLAATAGPLNGIPSDPAAAGLSRLRLAVTVLGPITIVTALLYYYGYVTTYAEYAYFGVDVELLDYSSADYVLRSPASLFVPLLGLLVLVGLGYWMHVSLAGWDLQATHARRARIVFWAAIVGAAALLFRATLGIVDGDLSARELIGTTPAALALGTIVALYSFQFRPARRPTSKPDQTSNATSTVAWVIGWCIVIASLFWLVNSFASAYGRGLGQDTQKGLTDQPQVILHTRSQLVVEAQGLHPPDILCESSIDSKEYPYRYINLRLLATSGDSYLLVPVTWTKARGIVIMVKKSDASLQLMDWPGVQPCDT
ncbi:hypothetical protein [Kribbella sp. CA-247076]|uniref:hypothetical protein n=1 Tax=Kribbella sp. CA-247076 TaxID=3239941 RepID=UPI003D93D394